MGIQRKHKVLAGSGIPLSTDLERVTASNPEPAPLYRNEADKRGKRPVQGARQIIRTL